MSGDRGDGKLIGVYILQYFGREGNSHDADTENLLGFRARYRYAGHTPRPD